MPQLDFSTLPNVKLRVPPSDYDGAESGQESGQSDKEFYRLRNELRKAAKMTSPETGEEPDTL